MRIYISLVFAAALFFFWSSASSAQTTYNRNAAIYSCYSEQCPPSISSSYFAVEVVPFTDENDNNYQYHVTCPLPTSGNYFTGHNITSWISDGQKPYAAKCYYSSEAPQCTPPEEMMPSGYCGCPFGSNPETLQCNDPNIDDCTSAIMTGGGNGSVSVNPDGSVSCSIGIPSGSCTGTFSDEACFSTPTGEDGDQCSGGNAFGTINGNPVCVGSGAVQETGSSDPSTWGESTGDAQIISEETTVTQGTNGAGQSVTTTTTTSTTATQVTDTQPDQTAAPYICEDGRPAADRPSCDSSVTCDPGYYLVYGSCVPLPTQSTTETVEQTQSTTTTTNNDTGEETTETSNSNTTKPGTGLAKVEVEGLDGPCNPSEPGYLDCVAGEPQPMPDHTDNGGKTLEEGFQEVYTRMLDSPVATAMRSVAEIVPDGPGNCAPLSMDLSNTPIGTNVSTTVHCDIAESMRGVLQAVMLTFYTIIGFRIFASA